MLTVLVTGPRIAGAKHTPAFLQSYASHYEAETEQLRHARVTVQCWFPQFRAGTTPAMDDGDQRHSIRARVKRATCLP